MAPKNRKPTDNPALPSSLEPGHPKRITRSSTRTSDAAAPPAAEPPAKKPKLNSTQSKPQATATGKAKKTSSPKPQPGTPESKKHPKIIIEASKVCRSFRVRALEVQEGLTTGVPGIVVEINPEEPRKGCFEIRDENGETFISLLAMPRPFGKMKALDMKKVVYDIIEKVK